MNNVTDTTVHVSQQFIAVFTGFRHPGNTQKNPAGFLNKTQQKTHTKLNSISVGHDINT